MDSLTNRLDELDRSYSWLGRQLGVHRSTPMRWAAGTMAVAEEHRAPMAKALGVSQRTLFAGGFVRQLDESNA